MIKFNSFALAAAAALLSAGAVQAAPIGSSFSSSAGTDFNAAALTGFQTLGDDMVGSRVTVFFSSGATGGANWVAGAAGSGSASAGGWSLALTGDSFSSAWTLTNAAGAPTIVGFSFDGVPGDTVFDIVDSPEGSPGSANGNAFGDADASAGVTFASAAYSNRLTIGGVFSGDLYTLMTVSFTGALGAGTFQFVADTDNADAARGGITPGIPEPETYGLMLAGLGLMGYIVRRRRGA